MKIIRYISDLLYEYECVIIPGLGGFLTNDKPASIQPNTHHFRPPYKRIMFNAYLKTNDGLLVNHIAHEENISYKEAKVKVDEFVNLCDKELKSGKRIEFHKIGSIFLNKNDKIIFEQDITINYNADAFGLTGFVSPAIKRTNAEEKLRKVIEAGSKKEAVADRKPKKLKRKAIPTSDAAKQKHARLTASQKKLSYKTPFVLLIALMIAMLVGWGFMNKDVVNTYYENYSSVIPLFYSQPNAYVINNIDKVPITKVSSSKFGSWWISLFEKSEARTTSKTAKSKLISDKKPVSDVVQPKAKSSTPTVRKVTNIVSVSTKPENKATVTSKIVTRPALEKRTPAPVHAKHKINSRQFYIIAGSFKEMRNVRRLVVQLKRKGYQPVVVGITHNGFHRVAFDAFDSRLLAIRQLPTIRKNINPLAWILVK